MLKEVISNKEDSAKSAPSRKSTFILMMGKICYKRRKMKQFIRGKVRWEGCRPPNTYLLAG